MTAFAAIARNALAVLMTMIGAFAFASAAAAAKPEIFSGRLNQAAGGYDVVAYFTQSKPVKGLAQHKTAYRGAEWRFASAANLEKFKAAPAAYAPQYGGYCAWAVSQNYTAPGNPNNWSVVGGKLFLNFNDKVQKDWLKDPAGFIVKADANWPKVLK